MYAHIFIKMLFKKCYKYISLYIFTGLQTFLDKSVNFEAGGSLCFATLVVRFCCFLSHQAQNNIETKLCHQVRMKV